MGENLVKDALERIAAYQKKVDADVVRSRIAARAEDMKEKAAARQAELAEYQSRLKTILDQQGVPPELNVVFFKVLNKLYGEKRKHNALTFESIAKAWLDVNYIKLKDWIVTQKLQEVLTAIASLFNLEWNPPSP